MVEESRARQAKDQALDSESPQGDDEKLANDYAMAIALGLPFGMLFGLLILDNISLGLIIGLAIATLVAFGRSTLRKSE